MRRIWLAVVLALSVLAPVPSQGQPPAGDVPRIGVLTFVAMTNVVQDDFRQGLREHGYVEGKNIVVEWRSAEGRPDRADIMVAELVRLKVAVIVAEFTPAVLAAKKATHTIPIVMASAGDPVTTGLVASLSRPGGNITGFTNLAVELSGKRLDLLREAVPGLKRVGLLVQGADPLDKVFVSETRKAAARAGIEFNVERVPRPEELDSALSSMTKERVGALIVMANLPVPVERAASLTLQHHFPTISLLNRFAQAGGLMSYGASVSDIRRRVASHVDRILKGAKPADLPVEQPTKFELVINMKTAKMLGVTIPQTLLLRADEVIE
jgi:putative ABC transport system substrate-binding protein